MVRTWTDVELAATIWVSYTVGPLIYLLVRKVIVRWFENTHAAAAALVRFASEGSRLDRQATASDDDAGVRDAGPDPGGDGDSSLPGRSAMPTTARN